MTFLELCKAFAGEIGIAGGTGPASVTNQTGELANVVRWIAQANLRIENLWDDWKFLWFEHRTSTFDADRLQPALPAFGVKLWHRGRFSFNRDSASRKALKFVPWEDFTLDSTVPSNAHKITERPDGVLILDGPAASGVEFYSEGQRAPVLLADNTDTPKMPAAFHRLIVVTAVIMYANKEDAPELISGFEAEYIDLLEKIEANQLPGGARTSRMAHIDEADLEADVGCIPGF